MTTTTTMTTQVYRVYIKATAQAIWDAITRPDWTERYGYGGRVEFDLRPGGAFRSIANEEMQAAGMPEVAVDGAAVEVAPPRKLGQLVVGQGAPQEVREPRGQFIVV